MGDWKRVKSFFYEMTEIARKNIQDVQFDKKCLIGVFLLYFSKKFSKNFGDPNDF